jgi:hypothetical protein
LLQHRFGGLISGQQMMRGTTVYFDLADTADPAFDRPIEWMLIGLITFLTAVFGGVLAWSEGVFVAGRGSDGIDPGDQAPASAGRAVRAIMDVLADRHISCSYRASARPVAGSATAHPLAGDRQPSTQVSR